MRRWTCLLLLPCAAALAGPDGFVPAAADGGAGNAVAGAPPAVLAALAGASLPADLPQADRVLVRKSERRLYLMSGKQILRSYRVSLGLMPEGTKERVGDYRTPEGSYQLTRRNPRSEFFLSIQVSYPGPGDLERARRNHADPGGSIMVHGQPNIPRHPADYYSRQDWTDGCIALSNADMTEFWLLTHDNMPIDIEP
jgi:murein L,D-transpeptidase YafK